MEKYLVEVCVPALNCTMDVRLPAELTFGQAARLVQELAGELPQADLPAVPVGAMTFFREDGLAYPAQALICRSDLCSGARLILL